MLYSTGGSYSALFVCKINHFFPITTPKNEKNSATDKNGPRTDMIHHGPPQYHKTQTRPPLPQ